MFKKQYTWHKIAASEAELFREENILQEIEVSGKKVCMAKTSTGIKGCAARCPHAGVSLAEGYLDAAGNIVCSVHRYKFNLQNGRNVSGEGYYLKTFPVEIREDGVYVGIEKNRLFG